MADIVDFESRLAAKLKEAGGDEARRQGLEQAAGVLVVRIREVRATYNISETDMADLLRWFADDLSGK